MPSMSLFYWTNCKSLILAGRCLFTSLLVTLVWLLLSYSEDLTIFVIIQRKFQYINQIYLQWSVIHSAAFVLIQQYHGCLNFFCVPGENGIYLWGEWCFFYIKLNLIGCEWRVFPTIWLVACSAANSIALFTSSPK